MDGNRLLDILLMVVVSFFAAFTVGLNKYATGISKGNQIDRLLMVSEILVHGFSGLLIGLIFTKFVSDIYILCAISGIGGMIGQKLLYAVARNFMSSVANINIEKETNNNADDN